MHNMLEVLSLLIKGKKLVSNHGTVETYNEMSGDNCSDEQDSKLARFRLYIMSCVLTDNKIY